MPILYLGLDPSRYPRKVFHYPVIRTVLIERLDVSNVDFATHFLFTSRSAVKHWCHRFSVKGEVLAIGAATAAALREQGIEAKVAPSATQEGVIELLETMELTHAYLFWPRSTLARPVIEEYLTRKKVPFCALDLYETKEQKLEPVPDLDDFDEIVFTSPTTVQAFLKIFGTLPANKKLTPIGPVTAECLQRSV
ncbi:MAG TPA: uroporphyrinogen-III synthase [Chlamydiales bacterium]|jgi:uroporphyrinogen-III synthase|nr:uroporphyrinogen-III synthase [Chlamydiales bacterium]